MFADDTNLFPSDENISKLFQQMNKELKSISTWFKANKLSINIDKTKWTIFYATPEKRFMPTKLKAHINTISTKISKSIGILYRARLIIPRKQLNQLYFSFVQLLKLCQYSLGFYPENQIVYSLSSTKARN